jgi:hypothetical protein
MDIPFRWWDSDGVMRAEMSVNDDPAKFGCSEMARGFPYCEANPDFPARGYASSFGWVILVTYNHGKDFELDLRPQFRQEHPFGYFTDRPRFFDGPHTDEPDLDFLSHTFLCGLGGELLDFRHEVHAVLGFSWGFSKHGPDIESFGPEPLSAQDWDAHRERLREACPDWTFRPGFSQHPLEP